MQQYELMSIPTPADSDQSARKNLHWLFVLRNLLLLVEALLILVSVYGLDIPLREVPLWGILCVVGVFNWLTWIRLTSSPTVSELELFFQITVDVLATTAILYFTGGATNPMAWFFLLPLIIAATVLPQAFTWYLVIFASGCYTVLMGYYQPLPEYQAVTLPSDVPLTSHSYLEHHDIQLHVFGMWFGFVFSAVLVAYFVVEMANTLRERERRLAEAREQALRNERVIALGTLAAGAAHEMGTPLGTMAILVHELEQEYDGVDSATFREKMAILRNQIVRCKNALSVMSASAGEARAEGGHLMPLTRYLNEVVEDWRQQKPQVALEQKINTTGSSPSLIAELTLTQALVNVLNNAAEVSPQGITMEVTWTYNVATIVVVDQGPGIAPDLSEHLGKTPITTKTNGLGVGLFLAFSTIERLGGSIRMTRVEPAGTRTTITLPLIPRSNQ
jgi:two-component system sensor histidine kinase RegB